MEYSYGRVLPLNEALEGYIGFLGREGVSLSKSEKTAVKDAYGYVTAEAVYAAIPSPHYNCSAMDGIAVMSRSTFGATATTPVFLEKTAFRTLDTGDPLPDDFDAVIMIEDVVYTDDGRARIDAAAVPWQHVRQVGEDICEGDMIIPSNSLVSAAHLGSLLAGGVREIKVWRNISVAILPTGDEIVPADRLPRKGEITEYNSVIFSAMLKDFGCSVTVCDILKDNLALLTDRIAELSKAYDMVLVNAGSSAGRDDYTVRAVSAAGAVFCHGVAIRPGKPAILGAANGAAVIGLPGYPVSAAAVMEGVVFPVIDYLKRSFTARPPLLDACLGRRIVSDLKYEEFVRVKLGKVEGRYIAVPMPRGAGLISSLSGADAILVIPRDSEGMEAGDQISVRLMKPLAQLERTLVINGSHDPIIDLIGDIMRRRDYRAYISSSHTGSMGGITAIKKGEALIAPIHLLDAETGVYNTPAIAKYLSDCDITLVKGVKRIQGLFVPRGNPKNILSIEDLKRVTFVNRQKGSGTRVLLDYLLTENNIEKEAIIGYHNEMYTHTAVATQVHCGNADSGLGVFSAAKLYGLDFVPLFSEEYDLVVRNDAMDDPSVKLFLEVLKSEEFKAELQKLGGYECV